MAILVVRAHISEVIWAVSRVTQSIGRPNFDVWRKDGGGEVPFFRDVEGGLYSKSNLKSDRNEISTL